jgi:hypothetical protein
MANEMLKQVAEDFKTLNPKIKEAEEVLEFARKAGEDVSTQEADLRKVKLRRDKWATQLKNEGYV